MPELMGRDLRPLLVAFRVEHPLVEVDRALRECLVDRITGLVGEAPPVAVGVDVGHPDLNRRVATLPLAKGHRGVGVVPVLGAPEDVAEVAVLAAVGVLNDKVSVRCRPCRTERPVDWGEPTLGHQVRHLL